MDEPTPTKATAAMIIGKVVAWESTTSPSSVEPMPATRAKGCGRLSVQWPTKGCRMDAVNWKVSVISPIWA